MPHLLADRMSRGRTLSRFGHAVRAARQHRGWSRETLAHKSGLSWAAITQIETGRRSEVRVSSVVALADALAVSADYLARGTLAPVMGQHRAYFYDSPAALADMVSPPITTAVRAGEAVMFISVPANTAAVKKSLGADGARLTFADSQEFYTTPREVATRLQAMAREALEACHWLWFFGEVPTEGRSRAQTKAWMNYESVLNVMFATWPVTIGCLYDTEALGKPVLSDVRRTHPELVTLDGARASTSYESTMEFVTS